MMEYEQFYHKMLAWYVECQAHDKLQNNRLDRFRNLEPDSAQFLQHLIVMRQAKKVLELGTSNGFSTAWLAYILQRNLGQLSTVEISAERSLLAQQNLAKLAINNHLIDFQVIDAQIFLENAPIDYDLIFLDAERQYYMNYIDDLKRLLSRKSGTTLVVDNVISHAQDVEDFLNIFRQDDQYLSTTINIGAGLFIVTKL